MNSRLICMALLLAPALAGCLAAAPLVNNPPEDSQPPAPQRAWFADVRVGATGAEPNIGISPTGSLFVTALEQVYRSRDGGYTWEKVAHFAPTQDPANDPFITADPMLWVDQVTGRVLVPQLFPGVACSHFMWSDDDGDTWLERPAACPSPGSDHPKIVTGPYPAGHPDLLGAAFPHATYYCYNKGYTVQCAASFDGGLTYAYDNPVAVDTPDGCAGLNGHPAVAPDGTLYVPFHRKGFASSALGPWENCDVPRIGVSQDGGLTWTIQKSPATEVGVAGMEGDMTVTPDGTAYFLYEGADHLQYLTRSTDRFQTWDGPWVVSAPGVQSTAMSAITSGDDGRIAIAYYGTRDTNADANQAPDDARWFMFAGLSFDAAGPDPSFEHHQLSPDDPAQVGCIWLWGGAEGCRNLLDFIDATTGPDGRVYIAYTDGCTEGCAGNPDATGDDSRDMQVAVAILERGPGLKAGTPLVRAG